MTVRELREKAKILGIKGRWDMNKVQLIEAISQAEKTKPIEVTIDKEKHNRYVKALKVGHQIAFESGGNESLVTAKVIAVGPKTVWAQHLISPEPDRYEQVEYDSIIWAKVKKKQRWPKFIFERLVKTDEPKRIL